ncbi:PREDICTED: fasciclin-like arabinogalactan protein 6 [Camelina sativa]|uniref:Fasciclin-like arabinogalactan protein 6 n=1 Tax=Camelina sativa TaxID=90675 RepID=A0ABM0XPP1_CAMSA|nr:PREDICTED: fasciclin-like arabinogalactan protein 6 [Camelina sativa]
MSSSIYSYVVLFFLFSIVPYIQSQPIAPAPTTETSPINLTAILETGHQFTTFMRLLNTTQVGFQVSVQLNSSDQGMTIFAPTDNAFNNLKPGTLNGLTYQQQIQLMLYHIIPKYYSLSDLLLASNPVRTQATGQEGGVFGLNFTGQAQSNQVNVSTGVVETRISNALRQQFPLGIYVVDKVLLPEELFGTKNTPTGAPAPKPITSSPDADSPAVDEEHKSSGSSVKRTSLGVVLGFVWFCCSVIYIFLKL